MDKKSGGVWRRPRAVIYLNLGWSSVPSLVRNSIRGRDSWHLRSRLTSRVGRWIVSFFGVRAIDLDLLPHLELGPGSLGGSMDRAMDRLDALHLDPLLEMLALRYGDACDAAKILRNSILRVIADRTVDDFYAQVWDRSLGYEDTVFVSASPWDQFVLNERARGAQAPGSASRGLAALGGVAHRVTLTLARSLRGSWDGGHVDAGQATTPNIPSLFTPPLHKPTDDCTVLLVLNMGAVYGGQYSYDYLFSENPDSPLHPSNVVVMARTGGPSNQEGIRLGHPDVGSRWKRFCASWGIVLNARVRWRSGTPWLVLRHLARVCARVDGQRRDIVRRYPSLRLAVFAYDAQVPSELVLALHSLGIPSIAVSERPLSVIWGVQPFSVSRLLTASEFFAASAVESPSLVVGEAIPVGMWRTDFLHEYRAGPDHSEHKLALQAGQKFVVALPFHAGPRSGWDGNPLVTGAASMSHFLTCLADLAEEMPELRIVIRGKNDSWVEDDRFASIAARIGGLPNIVVSREYGRLHESYRICARADLIIAKYTSLVDEALAVDIPCVVHDFTTNSQDFTRLAVSYLPRRIWAENEHELRAGVKFALQDDGSAFREWWTPHRLRIYGHLNDGYVRSRARSHLVSLVSEGQRCR